MKRGKRIAFAIISVVMGIYILCAAISMVQMVGVQRITYAETDAETHVYQVDFEKNEIRTCVYTLAGRPYDQHVLTLSLGEKCRLKFRSALAVLPMWRKNYTYSGLNARLTWGLEYTTSRAERTSAGRADWPITWRMLVPEIVRLGNRADMSGNNSGANMEYAPIPGMEI